MQGVVQMRGVSTQTLGPIPYAVSVAAVATAVPFATYPGTAATILAAGISAGHYADIGTYDLTFSCSSPARILPSSSSGFVENIARYTLDRSFPELIPDALVKVLPGDS